MKKSTLLIAILFAAGLISSRAQNTWTQKANFGGSKRAAAVGFSIGSKGYIGTGTNNIEVSAFNDFWEYDPSTDAWTQKADFAGTARDRAVGFSIGSKGYIGTGYDDCCRRNDFWEYDPAANAWTQKADFGGSAREAATGLSIGNKGYIGLGENSLGIEENDFWEYDPAADAWTQKADFGGTARALAVGFSIGSKGYIGTGTNNINFSAFNDFWEYDPALNAWAQKANFAGTARYGSVGFSIGSKGYIGTGYDNSSEKKDFWEYDPVTNTWTEKENFGGTGRHAAAGFAISNKGYIGTGYPGFHKDFWEYTPATSSCAVPTNLAVTNITSSSATLNWDSIAGAERYKVRYKVSGTTEWTKKNTYNSSKSISGLLPNTSYKWEVQTHCQIGPPPIKSDWSSRQEFTTGSLRLVDESIQQISLQIYPNPASDKITISFLSDEKRELKILNLLGQVVFSKGLNSTTEEIDVSKFQNGIYLITVTTVTQKLESKFLKQ